MSNTLVSYISGLAQLEVENYYLLARGLWNVVPIFYSVAFNSVPSKTFKVGKFLVASMMGFSA